MANNLRSYQQIPGQGADLRTAYNDLVADGFTADLTAGTLLIQFTPQDGKRFCLIRLPEENPTSLGLAMTWPALIPQCIQGALPDGDHLMAVPADWLGYVDEAAAKMGVSPVVYDEGGLWFGNAGAA